MTFSLHPEVFRHQIIFITNIIRVTKLLNVFKEFDFDDSTSNDEYFLEDNDYDHLTQPFPDSFSSHSHSTTCVFPSDATIDNSASPIPEIGCVMSDINTKDHLNEISSSLGISAYTPSWN
jgi:hypothetical protein